MKEIIISLLAKELKLKESEIENLIETPPSPGLGDYAFPCFHLAGKLKKSPVEIAKELSKKIEGRLSEGNRRCPRKEINQIKSNGPYINFFANNNLLAEQILEINEEFGKEKNKGKLLIEHTSVNPNASPHVGRARNSIIGDSISRILDFRGFKIERHYYVNDVSKQIAMLALVFKPTDNFDSLLKKYIEIIKKLKQKPELEKKVFELLHKFEHKDKKTVLLFKKIVDTAVEGQKKIFSAIGINFDYFDYESRYIESGKEVLKQFEKTKKLFKDDENRLVLNQANTGLERKMKSPMLVLTRSDGTGLYILRDLAYTIEKCKKGRNLLILGEDQKLYFEQLKQALILLKKPYPKVVHYSFVLLKDIGKMSTRSGEVVLLEEFISEAVKKAQKEIAKRKTKGDAKKIGIAAIKYAMLRNDNNKNITFDLDSALNFEGDSGPYLQYSYARASSILKKAKKGKQNPTFSTLEKSEIALIKEILTFKEIVKSAEKHLSPSLIANYSFNLAKTFNEFYHECPVINSENEAFRLRLIEAFRSVIKNSLYLLGIDVLEEM
ncbi:arginine--tRNA ligase [Candidatus Woesearchaeota archaeon CG10_big_fil_rev_8_21_14_0_10_34_12]|nr:MAG: arginine--tRNA ligase [Candidatus Woesearchaeota archaeon CG10_big_fil_rev_8_21_14_0_10_34_12]